MQTGTRESPHNGRASDNGAGHVRAITKNRGRNGEMTTVRELLGEELYAAVADRLGGRSIIVDDGKLIPKHRFDCINISLKEHKQLVSELREKADAYDRTERELQKIRTELDVYNIVMRSRPKNCIAVRANIKVGTLTGKKLERAVNKQLDALRASDPYLFIDDTETVYRLVPVKSGGATENIQ